MSYERHVYEDGIVIKYDGEEIGRLDNVNGPSDADFIGIVLEHANFGNPQREALLAVFGGLNETIYDDPMPDQS